MIIKIKMRYRDAELGREVRPGEELTVSAERGESLIGSKIAEFLSDGATGDNAEKDAKIAELEKMIAEKDDIIAKLEEAAKKNK